MKWFTDMRSRILGKKLIAKSTRPRSNGFFTEQDAERTQMRLAIGNEKNWEEEISIYLLVDPEDGIIADAKFQAFGGPALIAAAEIACDIIVRKNYDQARRISADLIDAQVRDTKNEIAFAERWSSSLNLVLGAIEATFEDCKDIPLQEGYVVSPLPDGNQMQEGFANWEEWTHEQRLARLNDILEKEVQPYIALDAGGVTVKELKGAFEVVIIYEGSCTSCYSATGATLNAIQQILTQKIHPKISVVPDLSVLQFS